jgi:RimJ/RimL family protein N-acetyltransferase
MTSTASIEGYGVRLDALTVDDLDMVLGWRNHPDVRTHMFTEREITPDEHRRWFDRVSSGEDVACFVARWRDEPVAFLSIRSVDGRPLSTSEWREPGVYLAPGSSLSGTLLALAPVVVLHDMCFSEQPDGRLQASVKSSNERAMRFNRQLGYVQTTHTHDVVRMELTRTAHERATKPLRRFLDRSGSPDTAGAQR